MTDRVFPSSKPPSTTTTTNGAAAATLPPPPQQTAATNAPAAGGGGGGYTKSNLYNPTSRQPYRPQPYGRGRHSRRSARRMCCCCCLWTTIIILILLLIAATAGAVLYILYHPHRPEFTVPSLRIQRLNLTTAADSSSAHLTTLLNLTIVSKNPNSHISFAYDALTLTSSTSSGAPLGNATLPGFAQGKKNVTTLRNVVVSGSNELDAESVNSLRSDLKKKNGNGAVNLKIEVDTKVTVTVGKVKSKKVGIRVTCDGIKGTVPKGKSPTVALTSGSKCKVDLRIKIWKFTF